MDFTAAPETYKEYRKVFNKYKELYGNQTAVFYQVGSFYELYDVVNKKTAQQWCNVKEIVEILGIQLSIKAAATGDNNLNETQDIELFFAGFPDYTLHRWAAKLTQSGWTVVVVEQKKDWRGKVEDRIVSRILSPGTHNENTTPDAAWVVSIWLEEKGVGSSATPSYGLVALDLTTGTTTIFQGNTRGKHSVWSADEALHFFQIHSPREVLLLWRGDSYTQPSDANIRRIFGIPKGIQIHFRQAIPSQQGSLEIPLVREELLKKFYKPYTILPIRESLQIGNTPFVERSLCALLRFIEDHFAMTKPGTIHNPISWNPTKNMLCGNNALSQLNITGDAPGSDNNNNHNECILALFNKCQTSMGKRAIRERILTPLIDVGEINRRLDRVSDAIDKSAFYTQPLALMFDLPRLHRKILNGNPAGGDILSLYQTYTQILALSCLVPANLYEGLAPSENDIQRVIDAFNHFFSVAKAEKADAHITFLKPGICPAVDDIEEKISQVYVAVRKWMEAFHSPDLRIEEKEKMPISVRGTKQIIQSIQMRASSNNELHTEPYKGLECKITKSVGHSIEAPFLERANEKILGLRAQLAARLEEALPQICIDFYTRVTGNTPTGNTTNTTYDIWSIMELFVEEVDCSVCFAKVAIERGFNRPTILPPTSQDTSSSFKATALRHPLIEALATRSKYVTHDVELGSSSFGWLLYGMNASGKSSLMKAIGIATILAQSGSFVPATNLEITPFERVMTRILNVDNLWAGLSSFAVEISELRDIFMRADNKTLVLGDELCSGTESVSATALVAAGIGYLLKKRSRFVFATHYHDLMKIPEIKDAMGLSVWHLKVRYDPTEDILIYERTLSPGAGSTLYGIEVAKALGMPQDVLDESILFRKALLGEKMEETLSPSAWNPNIVAKVCELCQSNISLEVHHIRPRVEASSHSRFPDNGLARDDARNLIVVCAKCHDANHAGKLTIKPLTDTSVGQRRLSGGGDDDNDGVATVTSTTILSSVSNSRKSSGKLPKWTPEQEDIIQNTITSCKGIPLKLIRGKLLREHQIVISESMLGKMIAATL